MKEKSMLVGNESERPETMTPRPKITDDEIVAAAAKHLLNPVMEWLKESGDDPDEAGVEDDLKRSMVWCDDGYEIAVNLDRKGWVPDARLVEILDGALSAKLDALSEACKAWVIATGAKEIPLETVVLWKKDPCSEGIVTRNSDAGMSTVTIESEGHKRGTGYVIAWEELTVKAKDSKP